MGSMRDAVTGSAFWFTSGRVLSIGLKFITVPILARILTPEQFGIVGVCVTITYLVSKIGYEGVASPLMRIEYEQNLPTWNRVIGICLLSSVLIAAVCAAFSSRISNFFIGQDYGFLISLFAALGVLKVLASGPLLCLQQKLKFKSIAIIETFANVIGAMVGIGAALSGYGVYSLFFQHLVVILLETSGYFYFSHYKFSVQITESRSRGVLIEGIRIFGTSLLSFMAYELPMLLIARLYSVRDAGLFSVSRRLVALPQMAVFSGVNTVLYSAYSMIWENPARLRKAVLDSTRLLVMIQVPAFVFLACSNQYIVKFVLGDQWTLAAPIFMWLALLLALESPLSIFDSSLRAVGKSAINLRYAVLRLLAIAFVFNTSGQLQTTIGFYVAVSAIVTLCLGLNAFSSIGAERLKLGSILIPPWICSSVGAASALSIHFFLAGDKSDLSNFLLMGAGFSLAYVACYLSFFSRDLAAMLDLAERNLLRRLRPLFLFNRP